MNDRRFEFDTDNDHHAGMSSDVKPERFCTEGHRVATGPTSSDDEQAGGVSGAVILRIEPLHGQKVVVDVKRPTG